MTTEEFQRKLTAILSADVQGYSRLMEEDEESTIRTLTAYRDLMSVLIQRHQGRVVDSPGDNLLAEFGSLTDAVHCAVEIQEELRIRNADLPENRKMRFRIGINLGEIIEEGDRIYGDGINVAARVEGLADGGGICISGAVYDAIKNKLAMSYQFIGKHNVKNIKEPIRIYRIRVEPEGATAIKKDKIAGLRTWQWAAMSVAAILILGAVAIWYFSFRQEAVVTDVEERPKTIAVLPFVNMSSDPEQEHFVDGLSEELLNSLAQIPDLIVIARTSAFTFKNSDKTVQEIASVLGVDNILEGSVRKAGNALRITAQLVKGVDGSHLWSKTYDRELKDIFVVQENISTAVADELKATLGIGSLKKIGGTDNEKAYELYLTAKGQYNDTVIGPALGSIDAALMLDPEFARAWALKSSIHNYSIVGVPDHRIVSELEEGLKAAQKTIELEPNLATGYASLGQNRTLRGEWIEAELAFRKALELITEPSLRYEVESPLLYNVLGYLQRAKEIIEAKLKIDPLNLISHNQYITCLELLGDTQRAFEENERTTELFGDKWLVASKNVRFYLRIESGDVVPKDEIPKESAVDLGVMGIDLESPEKSLEACRQYYITIGDNLPKLDLVDISYWAAYFGDPEFAMDVVEKVGVYKAYWLFNLWSPIMRDVRQLPRFKKFIKDIGFVDYWNKFGWPDICHKLDNGDFECD